MSAPDLATYIAKARDNYLTTYEVAYCLRALAELNAPGARGRIEMAQNEHSTVFLSAARSSMLYAGQTAEDALCAAYDDLQRIIAEEGAV